MESGKWLYFLLGLVVGIVPLLWSESTVLSSQARGKSQGTFRTSVMSMRGGDGEDCSRGVTNAPRVADPPPRLPTLTTGGAPPGLSFAKWRAENAALKFEALDRGLRSILTNDWSSPKEGPDPEFNVTVHTCAPLPFAPPSYNKSFLAHHTTRSFSPPTFPHATHQSSPTWCDALGRWSGTRTGSMGW